MKQSIIGKCHALRDVRFPLIKVKCVWTDRWSLSWIVNGKNKLYISENFPYFNIDLKRQNKEKKKLKGKKSIFIMSSEERVNLTVKGIGVGKKSNFECLIKNVHFDFSLVHFFVFLSSHRDAFLPHTIDGWVTIVWFDLRKIQIAARPESWEEYKKLSIYLWGYKNLISFSYESWPISVESRPPLRRKPALVCVCVKPKTNLLLAHIKVLRHGRRSLWKFFSAHSEARNWIKNDGIRCIRHWSEKSLLERKILMSSKQLSIKFQMSSDSSRRRLLGYFVLIRHAKLSCKRTFGNVSESQCRMTSHRTIGRYSMTKFSCLLLNLHFNSIEIW